MNRAIVPLLCSFLLLSASSASAFNVTKILSEYSDYSNFNDLLSKTGLASAINSRSTITLLAVPNGAIGDLTSKSDDVVRKILATHVVLDYYDPAKLKSMKDKTAKLTTMFQQSGKATNDQGFLNVTAKDNTFVFGSAVKGAQLNSRLEKSVMSQPYNISILGISQSIVTPGLDGSALAPGSAPPPKANAPSSPKSSPPAKSPAAKADQSPDDTAESPDEDTDASAPSKDSDSPPADAKSSSPPPSSSPSSAGKLKASFGLFLVLASMVAAY